MILEPIIAWVAGKSTICTPDFTRCQAKKREPKALAFWKRCTSEDVAYIAIRRGDNFRSPIEKICLCESCASALQHSVLGNEVTVMSLSDYVAQEHDVLSTRL